MEVKNTELADGHGGDDRICSTYPGRRRKGNYTGNSNDVNSRDSILLMHAMGAGDIKLFMALSCMTDYSIVLHTIIFSLCLAAVYGLFRLIRQGTLIQRILYFRTYMQSSLVRKQWVPYREQSGMDDSCMHLAPAVLGGYLLTLGVV